MSLTFAHSATAASCYFKWCKKQTYCILFSSVGLTVYYYRPRTKFGLGACMPGGGGGMPGRGTCVARGCAWSGGICGWGGVWPGACMARGRKACMLHTPHLIPWDMVGQWVGGTHPTGMHSCLVQSDLLYIIKFSRTYCILFSSVVLYII